MVYTCNICKKDFNSSSFEDLKQYCDHVAKCPLRSDEFLAERFSCMFCGNVLKLKRSFEQHMLQCKHPSASKPILNTLKQKITSKKNRNLGMVLSH